MNLNTFGFDIETAYNDFANIGFYYRFDHYQKNLSAGAVDVDFRLSNYIGLFTRFQYAPLQNRFLNLFSRIDVGAGPTIMKFSGISGQGALHFGIESYLTDWIGFSVSYGFVEEWGKETVLGNAEESKKDLKNIVVRSSGRLLQLALKTTYF